MFRRLLNYLTGNITIILAVILATIGSYHYGHFVGKKEGKAISKQVITEYENKVLTLEMLLQAEQGKINTKIETVYVDRVKTVKEKEYVYVKQAAEDVPATFQLSAGWVYLHDAAAEGLDADSSLSADATPSGIQDNKGIGVIVTNYSECRIDRERLKALQDWVTQSIENAKSMGVTSKE